MTVGRSNWFRTNRYFRQIAEILDPRIKLDYFAGCPTNNFTKEYPIIFSQAVPKLYQDAHGIDLGLPMGQALTDDSFLTGKLCNVIQNLAVPQETELVRKFLYACFVRFQFSKPAE